MSILWRHKTLFSTEEMFYKRCTSEADFYYFIVVSYPERKEMFSTSST